MPGAYDFLHPDVLRAGPRRVTVNGLPGYVIHDEPPSHVPPLPADKPDESRPDVERAARDFLSAVSRLPNPTQKG